MSNAITGEEIKQPSGTARSHEAGAGTVSLPIAGPNAGSTPAPRPFQEKRELSPPAFAGKPLAVGDVMGWWFDTGAGKTGGPRLVYGLVTKIGRTRVLVRPEGGDNARWLYPRFFDTRCTDAEIVAEVKRALGVSS